MLRFPISNLIYSSAVKRGVLGVRESCDLHSADRGNYWQDDVILMASPEMNVVHASENRFGTILGRVVSEDSRTYSNKHSQRIEQ